MSDVDDANRRLLRGWLGCDDLVAEGVRRWLLASRQLPPGDRVDDPRISYGDVTRGQVLRSRVDRLAGVLDPGRSSAAELTEELATLELALRDASSLDYAAAKEGSLGRAVEAQRLLLTGHEAAARAWERLAVRGTEVWHVVAALESAATHRDAVRRAERQLYALEKG